MMRIPSPKANWDDRVRVLNYRRRPERWESGKIVQLEYRNRFGTFSWSYEVLLYRESASGNTIRLYVGEDSIQAVDKE